MDRRTYLKSIGLVAGGATIGSLTDPLDAAQANTGDCSTPTPTPTCDCSTPTPTSTVTATLTPTPATTETFLGCGLSVNQLQPIDWTANKYAGNPVMLPGDGWESGALAGPFPVVESDRILVYYGGHDGSKWRIGRTISTDGITFERDAANPLFDVAPGTAGVPWIVRDGTWHLYYTRMSSPWRIGHASSSDGVDWTDHGAVLEPSAAWEGEYVANPTVVRLSDDDWRMWYWGGYWEQAKIGYATASDPAGPWTPYADNPVLRPSGAGIDSESVMKPRVGYNGSEFLMYYAGKSGSNLRTKTGLASSPDGIDWVRHHPDDGYLHLSQSWEQNDPQWDEVEELTPTCFGGKLLSYYSAVNAGSTAGIGLTRTDNP